MVRLTFRQILLLKVFKDYDGFNGKINIQKVIYAFQIAKLIDFHYKFETGFYGPFSEGLEQDIVYLCEVGLFIEEPYGRIRVKDDLTNKTFFNRFKDFFNLFKNNRMLEYRIVEMLERDLQTTERIELAFSFIYLILNKEIHKKEDLFNAIDRWKPGDFILEDKKEVWEIIIKNNIINERGEIITLIGKDNVSNDKLETFVYVDNPGLNSSNLNTVTIGFDDMLNIIYNSDSFWENLIGNIINRTECKYWDFKQTLEMWKAPSSLKQMKQIDFCEKIAAFANRKGGIIFIGITDKMPRKIIGASNLESKLQSINLIINKWIENHEDFFNIEEIILKDSYGIEKRGIAVIIAQTGEPVGVKNYDGFYSYPVRLETGLYRENFSKIKKKKKAVMNTNFNFLNLLNNNH